MGKKILVGLAIAFVLVCGVSAVAAALTSNASDKTDSPGLSVGEAGGTAASAAASKASPSKKAVSKKITISRGTWEVGTEVKAGKYRTPGAADSVIMYCSWQVMKGSENGEFITGGAVTHKDEPARVTLTKGQFFITSGCQEWAPVS